MKRTFSLIPFVFVLAMLLQACTLGPDYKRPVVQKPEHWRLTTDEARSLADLSWWELFRDDVLQDLIRTALEENRDLRIAVARIDEARAVYGFTRADLYPHIEGGLSGGRSRFSESVESIRGRPTHATDFQASVAVPFYEIDLWGRLRRLTESAQAQLLASEEARKTVAISLISAVAQSYIELRDLDQQRDVSLRTLASRRELLKITGARYANGLSTVLDVHEAESSVARAEDTMADIERRIGQKENELSILLGRNPGAIPRGEALTTYRLPPDVPAGLPSSLIERRPDIRQAEQNLIAANANIGAAKALMFPTISLTALFGYESSDLSNLFEGPSKIWTYAARATVPIFTAGKNRSRVEIAEAQQKSALLQYEQAVQQAFREVEDALIEYKKRREQYMAQEALVQAERKRLTLTKLRYINGIAPYTDVLNAQSDLFNAELSYSQTLRARLAAVVQLYRALGGGWETATATALHP